MAGTALETQGAVLIAFQDNMAVFVSRYYHIILVTWRKVRFLLDRWLREPETGHLTNSGITSITHSGNNIAQSIVPNPMHSPRLNTNKLGESVFWLYHKRIAI